MLRWQTLWNLYDEPSIGTVVVCVSAVRLALVIRVHAVVRADVETHSVILPVVSAVGTVGLETAARLGADADTIAEGDVLDVGADADGLAYDFVTNAAG
jgi:hypothetical protein